MFKRFIEVNGVPTNVTTWGQSINEPLKKKEIVLCITGNENIQTIFNQSHFIDWQYSDDTFITIQ